MIRNYLSLVCAILLCVDLHCFGNISTDYPSFCSQAIQDPEIFKKFRSHPSYQQVYGVPASTGQEYLNFICKRYPYLIHDFDVCRKNDKVGKPTIINYGRYGVFCPQTLKEIKIIGDLKDYFGDLSHLKIVEIGDGYGGLCHLLNILGGFASYTIIGRAECNNLTMKYLELQGIYNINFINIQELTEIPHCDLVISSDSFSQINSTEQQKCFDLLLKHASNGYLTLNSISSGNTSSHSVNSFISLLYQAGKKGKMEAEMPLVLADHIIIKWRSAEALKIDDQKKKPLSVLFHQQKNNAITYDLSGGRLGDNLLSYLHAKWVSYKYSLPLIFLPFPNSQSFRCHDSELRLEQSNFEFLEKRNVCSLQELNEMKNYSSTLFCIPFYYNYVNTSAWDPYPFIDWDDSEFKNEIKQSLEIMVPHQVFALPKDRVAVAVHIRRGGGADHPNSFFNFPLKFPTDDYYIQQIQKIYEILKAPLFVYIFTDEHNPLSLVHCYQQTFKELDIQFACRTKGNSPHTNILDDFYMLTQFDCLIRPDSNFSLVAAKLADYKIEISPRRCKRLNDQLIVDQVDISFNP